MVIRGFIETSRLDSGISGLLGLNLRLQHSILYDKRLFKAFTFSDGIIFRNNGSSLLQPLGIILSNGNAEQSTNLHKFASDEGCHTTGRKQASKRRWHRDALDKRVNPRTYLELEIKRKASTADPMRPIDFERDA